MEISQFFKDYGYIITVIIVPVGLWIGSIRYQNRQIRRNARLDLFLRLMAYRKTSTEHREWVIALNQIDVVFQDNQKVRDAWRNYFDSLNPKSQHFENANSFLLDMMSVIALSLGYNNLKQTDIDRVYVPHLFLSERAMKDMIQSEYLRNNLMSDGFSSSIDKEKYIQRLDYLIDNSEPFTSDILKALKNVSCENY